MESKSSAYKLFSGSARSFVKITNLVIHVGTNHEIFYLGMRHGSHQLHVMPICKGMDGVSSVMMDNCPVGFTTFTADKAAVSSWGGCE